MPRLEVRALRPEDWPALEALFGERGACGGCWCMAWRLRQAEWERRRGADNRAAFRRLVLAGRVPGVLAFEGERAVGWCSVAPRADFDGLAAKRSLATDWDAGTWSVTCFFLAKEARGRGVGTRLLRAAVTLARASGATRLEGYPAVPPRDGNALPSAFAWTGLPAMFEACGFRPLASVPGKRPIYVRRFGRGRSATASGRR